MSGHGDVEKFRAGCDCDDCTAAFLVWRDARRIVVPKVERDAALKGKPQCEHGSLRRYRYWGCRCELCRARIARERRRYPRPSKQRAS